MSGEGRTMRIERLELPASLARRPRLKAMIEEELTALLEASTLAGSLAAPSARVHLGKAGGDRETARKIAAEIFASLR